MGSSKTKTFIDVQIDKIYDNNNIFQQHFVSAYNSAYGDPVSMMNFLIYNKNILMNMNVLEKFGFKVTTGNAYNVTEYSLVELLRENKIVNTKINKIDYIQYYKYLDSNLYYYKYNDKIYVYTTTYNSITEPAILNLKYLYNPQNGFKVIDVLDENQNRLKYKTIDNKNVLLLLALNNDINISSTNDNYTYTYKEFIFKYNNHEKYDNVDIIYHKYKINNKIYSVVFNGSDIVYSYDSGSNQYSIKMLDEDNNVIWYTLPNDNTNYIVFSYSIGNSSKEYFYICELDKVLQINKELTEFLWIPVKHNGNIVDYDNAHKAIIKKTGLSLPSDIKNKDIKDVNFTSSLHYNNNDNYLNLLIKSIYGTIEQPIHIKINTKNGVIEYNRKNNMFNNNSSFNIYYNNYKIDENKQVYLLPVQVLKKLPIKHFYDVYYNSLTSWSYIKKKVKLRWYQSPLFEFINIVIFVASAIACPVCAAVGLTLILSEKMLLNPVLKNIGFNSTEITLIDTAINIYVMHQISPQAIGTNTTIAQTTSSSSTTITTINTLNTLTTTYEKYKLNKLQNNINNLNEENNDIQKKLHDLVNKRFLYQPFDAQDAYFDLINTNIMDLQDEIYNTNKYIDDTITFDD